MIKEQELTFLFILHTVWSLVNNYSKLFGIDPYECPTDVHYGIFEEEGKTVLSFSFRFLTNSPFSVSEMTDMMQNYLQYCLLPQQTGLQPYQSGSTLVEPLHVMAVRRSPIGYEVDILYVDNPIAFEYAKAHYGAIYIEEG